MAAEAAAEATTEAAEAATVEGERLSELLESGWRLLDEVEASAEPSSGAPAVQSKVQRGIALLERAAAGVAQLDLFSRHEELEEVATADVRFLLVPALLAALLLKRSSPDAQQRRELLQRARGAFCGFLRLCRDYGVGGRFDLPPEPGAGLGPGPGPEDEPSAPPRSEQEALLAAAIARRAKIERYKQKKEVENRLASLKAFVDSGQAEEEQIREFYLLQMTKWITVSLEEIESIDQEIAILTRRGALRQSSTGHPSRAPKPPVKSFILTRDAVQAKVFGAGYPSLATMTVDDWYEQHRKQGVLPDQGISQTVTAGTEEQHKNQEEDQVEEKEEESVWKAREWDDWKDMHPKGYGNRKNMG